MKTSKQNPSPPAPLPPQTESQAGRGEKEKPIDALREELACVERAGELVGQALELVRRACPQLGPIGVGQAAAIRAAWRGCSLLCVDLGDLAGNLLRIAHRYRAAIAGREGGWPAGRFLGNGRG